MNPIFILFTRSFWLTVATAVLFITESPDAIQTLSEALALVLPAEQVEAVAALLFKAAPVLTLVLAIQQRSGAVRPYSLNPTHK